MALATSVRSIPVLCEALRSASAVALDGLEADLAFCHPAIRGVVSVDPRGGTIDVLADTADVAEMDDMRRQVVAVLERSIASHKSVETREMLWRHDAATRYVGGYAAVARFAERWTRQTGPGQRVYIGAAATLYERLDARFRALATEAGAEPCIVPNIEMKDDLLEGTHYLASYPHIVTFGYHLPPHFERIQHVARAARRGPLQDADLDAIVPSGFIVQPAVCHNVYRAFRGADVSTGRSVTVFGRCYRYEGFRFQALLRGWEFSVRDVVLLGPPEWVDHERLRILELTQRLVAELDLDARLEIAIDPFFVSEAGSRRALQLMAATKLEIRLRVDEGLDTAGASVNRHGKHFAKPMQMRAEGNLAETACIGWGVDRWMAAFVSRWGDDPALWPAP